MTSNYEAWNGERYQWPPPDGWYLASDGRWWAPDTGPGPAAEAGTGAGLEAKTQLMSQSGFDPVGPQERPQRPVPPMHRTGPNPVVQTGQSAGQAVGDGAPTIDAGHGRPISHDLNGAADLDTRVMYASAEPSQAAPAAGPYAATGPISVLDHVDDYAGVPPDGPTAPSMFRPFGLHPAVLVAGLLVLAAVAVAAVLATAGGNDGELATTDDPTVIDDPSSDDAGSGNGGGAAEDATAAEGGVAGDDQMEAESVDDQSMADPADDESTDGSTTADGESTDDAGTGGTDDQSADPTTSTTADLTENLEAVTNFRATLDELGITSGELTAEEIVSFGETSCGYATDAADLDGYTANRDEALAEADNEELTAEELSTVVDTAVRTFCPEDADRLGL